MAVTGNNEPAVPPWASETAVLASATVAFPYGTWPYGDQGTSFIGIPTFDFISDSGAWTLSGPLVTPLANRTVVHGTITFTE